MKKIKLEELNLGNAEVLSREELKKVWGGIGSESGGGGGSDVTCRINTDFWGVVRFIRCEDKVKKW